MAFHDQMPGREFLFDKLPEALAHAEKVGRCLGLLLLDLDGYAAIRGRYGEAASLALLEIMAERLRSSIRESDIAAYFGGDTFAVLLSDQKNLTGVALAAERIRRKLIAPVEFGPGDRHVVGISMGISVFPDNATEADRLVTVAESALYASKMDGGNACTLYSDRGRERTDVVPLAVIEEELLTGIAEIDDQHRALALKVNALYEAMKIASPDRAQAHSLYDELIDYTERHFLTESRMMGEARYPQIDAHNREHRFLLDELRALKGRIVDGEELQAFRMLKDWLIDHIEKADKPMGEFLSRG